MTLQALGETARFINGAAFKPTDWCDEGLPIIRIQNLTGTGEKFNYTTRQVKSELVVEPGDLLVSWSATLDVYRWAGPRGVLNQHIFKVLPAAGIDPDYLFFALKNALAELSSKTHGSTMKHVVRGDFESTLVRVPPLPEQRRIVDLLSRAEGIVHLRREAEKKAAELIPTLFLDMFGDPATNPKGWPVSNLGEHVEIPSAVRTPDPVYDADHPCIGADSIEGHTGKVITFPTVRDVRPKSGKYWFDAGDVLYSKIRPYLAKACLAPSRGYCSADMYPLRCKSFLHTNFLLALLLSTAFTEYATAESVRAQMPKLNRETLFAYRFPVPPLKLQQQFADQSAAVRSIQAQQSAATAKAQSSFDALLAGVFSASRASQTST